jgi:hypothetical protein
MTVFELISPCSVLLQYIKGDTPYEAAEQAYIFLSGLYNDKYYNCDIYLRDGILIYGYKCHSINKYNKIHKIIKQFKVSQEYVDILYRLYYDLT